MNEKIRKTRMLDYEYQPNPSGDIQKLRNVLADTLRISTAVVQLSIGKNLCGFLVITKSRFTFIDGFHPKYKHSATFRAAKFILSLFGKEPPEQEIFIEDILHEFILGHKEAAEWAMRSAFEAIAAGIDDKLFTKAEDSLPFFEVK